MTILLAWLGRAFAWATAKSVIKWAAQKVLIISICTIVLPWVLKDALVWFLKVTSSYRSEILSFINGQVLSIIGSSNIDATITITSVAGYIANQIGLVNYFSILLSGFAICWSLKFIGRFL